MARLRGQGLTYAEIGWRLGVTGEAVRRALTPLPARPRQHHCLICGATGGPGRLCRRCQGKPGEMFGERLRKRRLLLGLTQGQLAARADIALATLSRLEKGPQLPYARTLARLLEALGVRQL